MTVCESNYKEESRFCQPLGVLKCGDMPGRFGPPLGCRSSLQSGHMALSFASLGASSPSEYQSCEMLSSVVQARAQSKKGVLTQLGEVGRSVGRLTRACMELWHGLQVLVSDAVSLFVALVAALLERVLQCISPCPLVDRFHDRPLTEPMVVVVVLVMMSTMYFAMYLCCIRIENPWQARRWTLVIFHKCFAMSLISYYRGVVTCPGGVPDSWQVGVATQEQISSMVKERKRSGELRICSKERKYKPDRAHYCSIMQSNVLRMDHYCVWMSNCVGHFNYKFFLQFLAYTVISSNLACCVMLNALYGQVYVPGTTVTIVGCAGLAGLLALVLTPFLFFHIWMLSRNMTTIEFCEKMEEGHYDSPYDMGVWANLRSVLGGNVLLWFLPVHSTPGNGIVWQRANFWMKWLDSTKDSEDECRDHLLPGAARIHMFAWRWEKPTLSVTHMTEQIHACNMCLTQSRRWIDWTHVHDCLWCFKVRAPNPGIWTRHGQLLFMTSWPRPEAWSLRCKEYRTCRQLK